MILWRKLIRQLVAHPPAHNVCLFHPRRNGRMRGDNYLNFCGDNPREIGRERRDQECLLHRCKS